MNKIYTINAKGLQAIKQVLQDCNKHGFFSNAQLCAYAQDAENSANDGDSVAVFEIPRMQSVSGFTQSYTLDLVECFDVLECKE